MDKPIRSGCPINLTLEPLGDRWSLIVIRDIMFGNRRHYRDLLSHSEEGIASNILADRLRKLTDAGLLSTSPDPAHKQKKADAPLLAVDGLEVHFAIRGGLMPRPRAHVRAIDGLSFAIGRGETLGLVGESGCGKSTTGLALMGLVKPNAGAIRLDGTDIAGLRGEALKASRRRMQIVFQDPYSSLNPRRRIGDIIRAPLDIHAIGAPGKRKLRVAELMRLVGLSPDQARAYPHQFSGGQRQHIGIARALASEPRLIICDEPVSALDVSVQAQILNLRADLQAKLGLSFLFISHDLGVVAHVNRRVAVMYLGRIVEIGDADAIFAAPLHPYTELLFRSAPAAHPRHRHVDTAEDEHEIPDSLAPIQGCRFHPRCPLAIDRRRIDDPALTARADGRQIACHVR